MAYATLQQLKQHLGITEADDDALLTAIISRTQSTIDAVCNRTFEADTDATRTLDAVRDVQGQTLWMNEDLASITSVTNGDGTTVTTSQYVTEPRNETPYYALKIRSDASIDWSWTSYYEDAISIVGRWAYSTTAPSDIVQATLLLASWYYRQKDTSADTDTALISDGIVVLPQAMPSVVTALLRPYRRKL